MSILLPEMHNPVVRDFMMNYNVHGMMEETNLDLQFRDMPLHEAVMRLKDDQFDAVVVGASHTTADVIREGLKTLGTEEHLVSSFFIMKKDDENLFFADCAVNPNPTPDQLVTIAEQTCQSVRDLGEIPTVAFLSFSTEGSAHHPDVDKIALARQKFDNRNPDTKSYGEVQFDSAYDADVYKHKTGELMDAKPNVLIFPDLDAGNIAYKIVERLAGYVAVGPLLQGFEKPLYDLSRGVNAMALREICIVVDKLVTAKNKRTEVDHTSQFSD